MGAQAHNAHAPKNEVEERHDEVTVMHSHQTKLYEVERIAGRRTAKGKEEFLVYWKGYDSSAATWEPSENLAICADIVKKFVSRIIPIPGGIPCRITDLIKNKKKTVGVQMLLAKKGRIKKNRMSRKSDIKSSDIKGPKRHGKMTETERLIRDTLLHESKSMSSDKTSLVVNGLLDFSTQNKTVLDRKSRVDELVNEIVDNSRKRKMQENSLLEHSLRTEKRANVNGISTFGMNYLNTKNLLRDSGEGDYIICQKDDNCMKIVLNNTAHHNVLTSHMMGTIANCLQKAERDPTINAVVLKNNGDYFCSGIDYSELLDCKDKYDYKTKAVDLCSAIQALTETLIDFPKPILTAVSGVCLEFGVALVVLSDLTFTSSKTNFELTFAKLNLTPVGCLTYLLPKVVGPTMANAMLLLGENYRATAAYDRGLINDIYGVHSFDEDIAKRIKQLAAGQMQVMEDTKRMIREFDIDDLRQACQTEIKAFSKCITSEKCHRKLVQDWTATINLYGSI